MKKPNAMFGVAFLLGTRQFDPDVFFGHAGVRGNSELLHAQ